MPYLQFVRYFENFWNMLTIFCTAVGFGMCTKIARILQLHGKHQGNGLDLATIGRRCVPDVRVIGGLFIYSFIH